MAEGQADEQEVMCAAELTRSSRFAIRRIPRLQGIEEEHSAAIERFLSGSATKDESRCVVRHLLARCPSCTTSAERSLRRSPLLALLRSGMAVPK